VVYGTLSETIVKGYHYKVAQMG